MGIVRKLLNIARMLLAVAVLGGMLYGSSQSAKAASQINIHGPTGSGKFGTSVTVLPNGNLVIADPYYDRGSLVDVGAVYLYDGATGEIISMLTGTTPNDQVGSGGVTVLTNGNYVISSPNWDNGTATDAGAATWGNRKTGISGIVSSLNSLVGSTSGDQVSAVAHISGTGIFPLSNGNYVVRSWQWDNELAINAGAITWANGSQGITGEISALNSLVGSTAGDAVGYDDYSITPLTSLTDGNFVVSTPFWHNGDAASAGAVTWADGNTGVYGEISALNSLVGSTAYDQVGHVLPYRNGDFFVRSTHWDNGAAADAGAITWVNRNNRVVGEVSANNSLVGSSTGDYIGSRIIALNNDNYLVISDNWANGAAINAGAVTWVDGESGITGEVSAHNSLVGSTTNDRIGGEIISLDNGNYVAVSLIWDNGPIVDVGAVTWGNGESGIIGEVSSTNSLVGTSDGDRVGYEFTKLSNGNYVVGSPRWDNVGIPDAGAATWGDGNGGVTGVVSELNSLVGSAANDSVGGELIALNNGNFVVNSPIWDNGTLGDVGAVTCVIGTGPFAQEVSAENSLVGSTPGDRIGFWNGVTQLSSGNYVVRSIFWDNGYLVDAGAVTWGDGNCGLTGEISGANSLVGSMEDDRVGEEVIPLSSGNFVVISPLWEHSGAVTWGDGKSGIKGEISELNSLVGGANSSGVGDGGVTALSNGNYLVFTTNMYRTIGATVTWGDGNQGTFGAVSELNSLVHVPYTMDKGGNIYWPVIELKNGNYLVTNELWNHLGAVTFGDGYIGVSGAVSEVNSLVGSYSDDGASIEVFELDNGSYVVKCPSCDQVPYPNVGAISWSMSQGGLTGLRTPENSVFGTTAFGGFGMTFAHDMVNNQLVVGRPADNIVTLFKKFGEPQLYLPLVVR